VLSKSCTDKEIASEFSPERALYYIHGWTFPSIDGARIDLSSLSFGKNTPIFPKSCGSNVAIKSSRFVTIMKKIFKPYIRNKNDLKLFAGHAWRIGRTHDSMKMQLPKGLICKSGGWDTWATVLNYLYGGAEILCSLGCAVPSDELTQVPVRYFED